MEEIESATEYCWEEIATDEEIERKPPKPHELKGKSATPTQLANLQKGREKHAKKKETEPIVAVKKIEPIEKPLTAPIEKIKKKKKQVIVIQSDSESSGDDSPPQIVIRTKKNKPSPLQQQPKEPEPPPVEVQPFRLRRV